jgi:hypothetical protein
MDSDEGFQKRSCTGKIPYQSQREAKAIIRAAVGNGSRLHKCRPYACRYCGHWHIGEHTAATKQHKRAARAARQEQEQS